MFLLYFSKQLCVAQALAFWANYGHSQDKLVQLKKEMVSYGASEPPYDLPCDADPRDWWKLMKTSQLSLTAPARQLPRVALIILDILPHSADPERVFSGLGWIHNKRRNRIDWEKASALMTIKMFHTGPVDSSHSGSKRAKTRAASRQSRAVLLDRATSRADSIQVSEDPAHFALGDDDAEQEEELTPEQLDARLAELRGAEDAAMAEDAAIAEGAAIAGRVLPEISYTLALSEDYDLSLVEQWANGLAIAEPAAADEFGNGEGSVDIEAILAT